MYNVLDNSFHRFLPADEERANFVRQVKNTSFSYVAPKTPSKPQVLALNFDLAGTLGIDDISSYNWISYLSGSSIHPKTEPSAMCYGGHQFGQWAGQLGDGRAINLFEVNYEGKSVALQLKGAGKTPYSRSADGLAVLRSSIREYLCSEAMHYLNVPTTRALSLISSGDEVWRDMLYDGNGDYEPGAIVCRTATSFIRFGNFQIHAARKENDILKNLADYVVSHFYPSITINGRDKYLEFLSQIAEKTIDLVVEWERVGFVHGVMNTDNMSILGLTIDYGPYGWLDEYDPTWTPNTTDARERRYRYGNQANIAYWNIYQLANALYPLINDEKSMEYVLDQIPGWYLSKQEKMMQSKLGISHINEESAQVMKTLPDLLYRSNIDMTIFYRNLIAFDGNIETAIHKISNACYENNFQPFLQEWKDWLAQYHKIIANENPYQRLKTMKANNPKYVLRNYMAQLAIDDATKGDMGIFNEIMTLIKNPYDEQIEFGKWFEKRPDWAKEKVGCSMLSCSS